MDAIPRTPGKKGPEDKAFCKLNKAMKKTMKSCNRLEKKGDRATKKVLKDVAKTFFILTQAGDLVLPLDLRNSMPGDHLSLK